MWNFVCTARFYRSLHRDYSVLELCVRSDDESHRQALMAQQKNRARQQHAHTYSGNARHPNQHHQLNQCVN